MKLLKPLGEFVKILEEHPEKWMLWEAEPASENVERLRSLGVESIVFDPCSNRPEAGDFPSVLCSRTQPTWRMCADSSLQWV